MLVIRGSTLFIPSSKSQRPASAPPRPGSTTLSQRRGSTPLQSQNQAGLVASAPLTPPRTPSGTPSRTPPPRVENSSQIQIQNLIDEHKVLYQGIKSFSFVPGLNYIIKNKPEEGSQEMINANHYLIQYNNLLSKNEDEDENRENYTTYSMNFNKIHMRLYNFIKKYSDVRKTKSFNRIKGTRYYSNNGEISVQKHIEVLFSTWVC